MKRREQITFINEEEAAKMLNIAPITLRRKVKNKIHPVPINYRNTAGRKFQYVKEDIEAYQLKTSTIAA
jgi:hypothetical protein